MAFEILSAQLDDTTKLHLEHPITGPIYDEDDESKPVIIELYGPASKVHQKYMSNMLRKNAAAQKGGRKEKEKSLEEHQEDNADFYATLTKSISNLTMGGKELTTKEDFKELYSNLKVMWIVEQVAAALKDTESFLQK